MRKSPNKGFITLAFDDAYLDTFRYAIRHLSSLNIQSTIAVPFSFIGKRFENRPLVGLKELREMLKHKHEIASHTLSHPNLLRLGGPDKEKAFIEIAESKKCLEGLLRYKVTSFVFPYIKSNQSRALRSRTKDCYRSARITRDHPCFNKIPVTNPYSIAGFSVMKKHSLSHLNRLIDHTQKNNLWLIEVFHLVAEKNTQSAHRPKPYRFFMNIGHFKRHLEYILSKEVTILTQRDAVRILSGH